eukprot:Rhum_TRINITY_DN15303_c5_g3::Rhum_TRINITY_DN15303_c5_g3_i6::g.149967::m.149967
MRAATRSVACVASKSCGAPHAAASQHQVPLLPLQAGTPTRTPIDLKQTRLFSASATTANKVPVPSTGVPAQGERAPAAVEESKETVSALEAEKKVLREQIALLEEHCFGEQRAEVTKQLRDLRIFVPTTVEGTEAKLAELKENLKSVNTQLETARRANADLVARQSVQQEKGTREEIIETQMAIFEAKKEMIKNWVGYYLLYLLFNIFLGFLLSYFGFFKLMLGL